ncbi:hypothetical protein Tco_1231163 [Tanacetum coccineum]
MEYRMKKVFGLRWNCRDHEAEVFQVSNDDTAVAQRRLEDKQPEEKTNTDFLVKEREKVHLGIEVGANITLCTLLTRYSGYRNVCPRLYTKVYLFPLLYQAEAQTEEKSNEQEVGRNSVTS